MFYTPYQQSVVLAEIFFVLGLMLNSPHRWTKEHHKNYEGPKFHFLIFLQVQNLEHIAIDLILRFRTYPKCVP